ncbi:MAG: hypothetical protein ACE5K3_00640 [bacterium]
MAGGKTAYVLLSPRDLIQSLATYVQYVHSLPISNGIYMAEISFTLYSCPTDVQHMDIMKPMLKMAHEILGKLLRADLTTF